MAKGNLYFNHKIIYSFPREKPRPTPLSTNFTLSNLIFDLQTSATYPLVTNYSFATQAESLKLQGVAETFQISFAR